MSQKFATLPTLSGRSREGAWIEIAQISEIESKKAGRSREGAWIEIGAKKYDAETYGSRSREGAWIEIKTKKTLNITLNVAPVRERGLKCTGKYNREGSARSLP